MGEAQSEGLPCVECDLKATYYCVDCDNFYFCTLCFNKIHSFNIFKRHVKQRIDLSPRKGTPIKEKTSHLDEESNLHNKPAGCEQIVVQKKEPDEKQVERQENYRAKETKVPQPMNDRCKTLNKAICEEVNVRKNFPREEELNEKNDLKYNEAFSKERVNGRNKFKPAEEVKAQRNLLCNDITDQGHNEQPQDGSVFLNMLHTEEAARKKAESEHREMKNKKRKCTEILGEKTVNRLKMSTCDEEANVKKNTYYKELQKKHDSSKRNEFVLGWQSYNNRQINHKEEAEKLHIKPKYNEVNVKKRPYSEEVGREHNESNSKEEILSAKQQYKKLMGIIYNERVNGGQKNVKPEEKVKNRPYSERGHKRPNILMAEEVPVIATTFSPTSHKGGKKKIELNYVEIKCRKRQNSEGHKKSRNEIAAIFEIQKYNEERVKCRAHIENGDGKGQIKLKRDEISAVQTQTFNEKCLEITYQPENERERESINVSIEETDDECYNMKQEEAIILEKHVNRQMTLNRDQMKNVSEEEYVEMLKREEELKGQILNGERSGLFVNIPNTEGDIKKKRKLELCVVLEKLPHNEERVFAKNKPNNEDFGEANDKKTDVPKKPKRVAIKREKINLLSEKEDGCVDNSESAMFEMSVQPAYTSKPRFCAVKKLPKPKCKKKKTGKSKRILKGDLNEKFICEQKKDRLKKCTMCGKTFANQRDLARHAKTHTDVKPHLCHYCNKAFLQRCNLVTHERTHTGEKPHVCQYCNASFRQKIHMVAHIRKHTGERPYPCEYCEKRFARKNHLIDHTRIHTGYKPFQCPYCEKSFCLILNLKTHMRMHTGESPFGCFVCGKHFNVKTDLVRHSRIHTGEKPFQCSVCKFPFSLKANMLKHMKSQHNNTYMRENNIVSNSSHNYELVIK